MPEKTHSRKSLTIELIYQSFRLLENLNNVFQILIYFVVT